MDVQAKPAPQDPKPEQPPKAQNEGGTGSREIHHHYHRDRGNQFFPRAIWGIFIIVIGLILLAQSSGLLGSLNVGRFFSHIWPVFIILAGLSIISRGGWVSGLISLVIALAAIALVILYALGAPVFNLGPGNNYYGVTRWDKDQAARYTEINVGKEAAAKSAEVYVNAGAGKVRISSGTGRLAEGSLRSDITELETVSSLEGDVQKVALRTRGSFNLRGLGMENVLDLKLSDAVPLKLDLNSGASGLDADLRDLQIKELALKAGASSIRLDLGDRLDQSSIQIEAGASSVNITLPRTIGARIIFDSGLSAKNLKDFKQVTSKSFQSENYDQAAKKMEIIIRGGASSITADWR